MRTQPNRSQRLIQGLKHEVLEAVPPAIFFFIAFQIIAVTQALLLEEYGLRVSTFLTATIAALVVAKVVLLADLLPFVNRYPARPLIYNIAWKTLIYIVAALLVRLLEHLFRFWREYGDVVTAIEKLDEEIVWSHFWYVIIWLLVLFLAYTAVRELVRALGADRVRQLFFGPPRAVSGDDRSDAGMP